MSVFDGYEDFFELDIRKHRKVAPVKKSHKIEKYSVLLPEEFVKDKTILDLGSCMGDVGHWVLSYGAKQYVGIEIQKKFQKTSEKLLSKWGSKAKTLNIDIIDCLKNIGNFKFDIIVFFGTLYAIMEPLGILKKIFNHTDALLLDSMTPSIIVTHKIKETPIMELSERPAIVSQTGKFNFTGISNTISRSYIDKFAFFNGFIPSQIKAFGEDYYSKIIYNDSEVPMKFYAKYVRSHDKKKTLQENIKDNDTVNLSNFHFTNDVVDLINYFEEQKNG